MKWRILRFLSDRPFPKPQRIHFTVDRVLFRHKMAVALLRLKSLRTQPFHQQSIQILAKHHFMLFEGSSNASFYFVLSLGPTPTSINLVHATGLFSPSWRSKVPQKLLMGLLGAWFQFLWWYGWRVQLHQYSVAARLKKVAAIVISSGKRCLLALRALNAVAYEDRLVRVQLCSYSLGSIVIDWMIHKVLLTCSHGV